MSKKPDRRRQILARAREVFAKKGYHLAKIDDIVASAKIARGTFYLYFSDKRSIFEELVATFSVRIEEAILRVDPHHPEISVEAQIRQNIRGVLSVLLGDRLMTKILLVYAHGADGDFQARQMQFYAGLGQLFMESLAEGQELGLVREGDVRLYAYYTIGGIKEILFQTVMNDWHYDLDATIDSIYALLVGGFINADRVAELPPSHPRAKEPEKSQTGSALSS